MAQGIHPGNKASLSMGIGSHRATLGSVGSYQVAGKPWMTGSTDIDNEVQHKISFPQVTKSITVINKSSVDLRIHFNDAMATTTPGNVTGSAGGTGSGLHYITLTEDRDSITFNVKCKEIYITSQADNGAYEMFAELTHIAPDMMYPLTGSGLTD